jgi:acyltransferase
MKEKVLFALHRLFLYLSLAYIGLAVSLFIIYGPIETELLGHKVSFTSFVNPIRISLGLVLLSFLCWGLGTDKDRALLTRCLNKGWQILQPGGLIADNRIYWIDNLRTLAILLMVFGHTNNAEAEIPWVIKYIYSFHMPLFFFISGLTFNPRKYQGWKTFMPRKASTLLIPYFFFSFLGYGFFVISHISTFSFSSFCDVLLRIVIADTDLLYFTYDGPLWFLPCLFLVEIECYAISFLKKRTQIGVIGVLAALGLILGPQFKYIPWTAAGSLVGLFFCWLGFLSRERIPVLNRFSKLTIIVFGILISVVFCYVNGPVSMAKDVYGNPFFFLLSAVAGTICVVLLITYIRPNKILSFIGMNTIIIL